MTEPVRDLLQRLSRDPGYADAFFSDRAAHLAALDLHEADRDALSRLDREGLQDLLSAGEEPPVAPAHPSSRSGSQHTTALLAFWCCAAYVALWLLFGALQ